MDLIQKLATCDFGQEIYHPDGEGHVQVEYRSNTVDPFDSPYLLLEQVEQEGLWPEFFKMAKTKDDEWIQSIMRFFPHHRHYTTRCFVEFLSLLSSKTARTNLIQDASNWLWDDKNISLIDGVLREAVSLKSSGSNDPFYQELELSMLDGAISTLETIKDQSPQ